MTSENQSDESSRHASGVKRGQFTVATLLWLMFTVGLALAYLRSFGTEACLWGLAVLAIGLVSGITVGLAAKHPGDAIFWALLAAFLAYLCTLGVTLPDWSAHFAWATVGAATGAAAGTMRDGRPLRMFVGALVGGFVFAIYVACFYGVKRELLIDALVAPLAGGLLGAVIEAVAWAERRSRSRQRRNICAAGLMLAVIVANMAASRLIAGW